VDAECNELAITQPLTDLRGVLRECLGGIEVAGVLPNSPLAEREESVGDALGLVLKMTLRLHEPPHRNRRLASLEVLER
jgi:hypothetical protein